MSARRPCGPAVLAWTLCAGLAAAAEPAKPPAAPAVSGAKELRTGVEAYRRADYEAARAAFERAAGDARVDPALVKYDLATALLQLGQVTNAAPLLREALGTTNLQVQARARHNLGQARAAEAEALAQQQKLKEAVSAIGEAVGAYERALTLAPAEPATKKNYELARRREEELKKLLEEQKQQEPQDQQKDQQQDQQQQSGDPQDQQKDQAQPKDQSGDQQKTADQPPPPQDQPDSSANKPQPSDVQPSGDQPGEGEPVGAGELTPEEARRLLDAMKEEEAAARDRMRLFLGRPVPVDKDW